MVTEVTPDVRRIETTSLDENRAAAGRREGRRHRAPLDYMAEADAATIAVAFVFWTTMRQKVIRTATFLPWLRTTCPAARRQIGSRLFCFEGQSMIIST